MQMKGKKLCKRDYKNYIFNYKLWDVVLLTMVTNDISAVIINFINFYNESLLSLGNVVVKDTIIIIMDT